MALYNNHTISTNRCSPDAYTVPGMKARIIGMNCVRSIKLARMDFFCFTNRIIFLHY